MEKKTEILIASNKRAHHDYFIEETYECGIVLKGTEIKSIRNHKCSINESYCDFKNNELYIYNMNIATYEKGNIFNHDPLRDRKLLLHKHEIIKLANKKIKAGYTLIPLKVVIRGGLCKVDIALARGKKLYDKREDLKIRALERD